MADEHASTSEHVRRNRARWDAKSDWYQQQNAPRLNTPRPAWGVWHLFEDDQTILGDVSGRDVLGLGCGAAQWSIALARDGARVVGMDLSARQLGHAGPLMARARVWFPLVRADAEHLSFRDASFDLVFC